MKTIGLMTLLAGLVLGFQIKSRVASNYRQEKGYFQYWELAGKSATVADKQQYIEQFAKALQRGYVSGLFASHDAIWLRTPNNSFERNLEALRAFSARLGQINKMNPSSLEYSAAMLQITAQEDHGGTKARQEVFHGCYNLANYPMIWNWIGMGLLLSSCFVIFFGFFLSISYYGF